MANLLPRKVCHFEVKFFVSQVASRLYSSSTTRNVQGFGSLPFSFYSLKGWRGRREKKFSFLFPPSPFYTSAGEGKGGAPFFFSPPPPENCQGKPEKSHCDFFFFR